MGGVLKLCFVLPKANLKQLTEDSLTKCQHILVTDCFFFFMWERKNLFAQKSFETVCRKSDVHTMDSSSILSSSGGTEQTEKY